MQARFHVHYYTHPGETLLLYGSAPECGGWNESRALEMLHLGDGYWSLDVHFRGPLMLEYRYLVCENDQIKRREWGENHQVVLPEGIAFCWLYDFWQPEPEAAFLYTSAYTESLLAIERSAVQTEYAPDRVVLKVQAPFVRKGQCLGISGDVPLLGLWDECKALRLNPIRFPEWSISLHAKDLPESFQYKFVMLDDITGRTTGWEWGEPRSLFVPRCMDQQLLMHSGMVYRFQDAPWRGAGVVLPVFSLRSENGWGCGDFGDLRRLTDWAVTTGQQMIQVLPVNDTTFTETWLDSYPYNAVSIFALHPIYANIGDLPTLKDGQQLQCLEAERLLLNALPEMDYEGVLRLKWTYFRILFEQEGAFTLETESFKRFFERNSDWLVPYTAFCYLRKRLGLNDFRKWGTYATYHPEKVWELCAPHQVWYKDIAIHYFVQYYLHRQLRAARVYAHQWGVVLKGDVPIGISRHSVEAWTTPDLFNTNVQVGAPPDDFSVKGQNWGFPSYHWERMKADGLRWWKRRFSKMADYFDAYRIDHLLGFFRIWEIPIHSVEGLLGHFSPSLPLSPEEMIQQGFRFEEETMTVPYLTDERLKRLFGRSCGKVTEVYLERHTEGRYRLKPEYDTQQKIGMYFGNRLKDRKIRDGLMALCNEVLFVRDLNEPNRFHPRILGSQTACYQALDASQRKAYDALYVDFFYTRNIDFWKKKAMEILPTLIASTRMLVCGEDLGMIPSCVPEVMQTLGILSLEIQRMPKRTGALFENLNAIPYPCVCTTSTHDMNPIRAWWLENPETSQQYYQQVLWKKGEAPLDCTPEVAAQIVRIHLESPALWVVLPWQDWLSFDEKLRHPDPVAERINVPSDPRHYWKYRMHLSLEQLLKEDALNGKIRSMIARSGRMP